MPRQWFPGEHTLTVTSGDLSTETAFTIEDLATTYLNVSLSGTRENVGTLTGMAKPMWRSDARAPIINTY